MSEVLDIYDSNMKHVGISEREEVHTKGYWHKTFHCWVVSNITGEPTVLVQLRGSRKGLHPNKLDISAAGHLGAGEKIEDGVREVIEELGINVRFSELIFLGIRTSCSETENIIDKELAHVYLYDSPYSLDQYQLQEQELDGIFEVSVKDGIQLFTGETDRVQAKGLLLQNGAQTLVEQLISVSDFIPRIDNYYLKIFIMADLYFKGYPYLSI